MKKLLILPIFIFLLTPFYVNGQSLSETADKNLNTATAYQQTATNNTIQSAFGIGPRLGYYTAEDSDDGNFYYGLQMRARMSPAVGLEGSVEYRPGTETGVEIGGVSQSYETKFVPVTGSLMLFIPAEGISPYALGGIGAYYTIYDADGDFVDDWDSEFNFGYHAGLGLELNMSSNAALGIDYRYLFLTPENENAPEDADYSGNVFTASLMFYF